MPDIGTESGSSPKKADFSLDKTTSGLSCDYVINSEALRLSRKRTKRSRFSAKRNEFGKRLNGLMRCQAESRLISIVSKQQVAEQTRTKKKLFVDVLLQ